MDPHSHTRLFPLQYHPNPTLTSNPARAQNQGFLIPGNDGGTGDQAGANKMHYPSRTRDVLHPNRVASLGNFDIDMLGWQRERGAWARLCDQQRAFCATANGTRLMRATQTVGERNAPRERTTDASLVRVRLICGPNKPTVSSSVGRFTPCHAGRCARSETCRYAAGGPASLRLTSEASRQDGKAGVPHGVLGRRACGLTSHEDRRAGLGGDPRMSCPGCA